jgi:hypothetical protein
MTLFERVGGVFREEYFATVEGSGERRFFRVQDVLAYFDAILEFRKKLALEKDVSDKSREGFPNRRS